MTDNALYRIMLNSMSPADLDLYADAAYGTPHEPFIRGQVAYGAGSGPVVYDQKSNSWDVPPTEAMKPNDETRQRAAATFAASLRNPILSYGLDLSEHGMVPAYGSKPEMRSAEHSSMLQRSLWGVLLGGAASKESGRTFGQQSFTGDTGYVDAHEQMHRGLFSLDVPSSGGWHHDLMSAQNEVEGREFLHGLNGIFSSASGRAREQLPIIQGAAQEAIRRRKPFGGPR